MTASWMALWAAPWIDGDTSGPGLAAAAVCGVAFGAALERAGLGSARKLVGQFYGADLAVFKVMFTAIVVAMLGAFWLARLGVLDLARVAVPETWVAPQLIGGAVFGAGLALAGLCPGTSCVAAASGRADGLAVVGGMFAGVLVTGLGFAPLRGLYEATPRGALTLPDWLGMPYGLTVALVVAVALIGFTVAARIEGRGNAPIATRQDPRARAQPDGQREARLGAHGDIEARAGAQIARSS